jgi:SAM-dependent methyltransferase
MKPTLNRVIKKLPQPAQDVAWRAYRITTPPYARTRLSAGVRPLSFDWGADRGQEIARYYVEELFLREFANDIQGHCLEFASDRYTSRFGDKTCITKIDILNVEYDNPHTTIRADLTKPNDIADDQFDCIICTHALHVIYEFEKAIADLHRILRPGGVLLMAVPHVSMCDPDQGELWRFTQEGLRAALAHAFDNENITMRAYGNSLTAAGQIRGLAAHEFTKRELHYHDQRFAADICARAMKRR